MKKFLITSVAIMAMMSSTAAFAADASTGATSTSTSAAQAGAVSASGGNTQAITFTSPANTTQSISATSTQTVNSTASQTINATNNGRQETVVSGTETIKNVPNPNAPALTTSNDTCMGSTSGSVTIAGFGIGGGTTWTDTNCKRLKNSRELWNMGMRAASLALLCMDADNRTALQQTGYTCPASK